MAVLNELAGTRVWPTHAPGRAGDVGHSLADIGAAGALLGYVPHVSVREGLQRTLDFYRAART